MPRSLLWFCFMNCRTRIAIPTIATLILAAGCAESTPAPCPECAVPVEWTVAISPTAPEAVKLAADDVVKYLGLMGRTAVLDDANDSTKCRDGVGRVVFIGDGIGEAVFDTEAPTDQTFRFQETWCGSGILIELSGGGLLGRQYAAYDWLHGLGIRFFHPEQEYVPAEMAKPAEPAFREFTPAFKYRSVSLHLTHPLEMGDIFTLGKAEHLSDGINYIDWCVKNLASDGRGGIPVEGYEQYGIMRGFTTSAGFRLYGMQQGNHGLIDPDDPRPADQQITDKITELMGTDPDNYPDFFSFNFDPTEFTEMDDQLVVHQMTVIADFIDQNYPGVQIVTTNHGTYGEPTAHYGVRYFNLPQFAPESIGVKCHTLMFYDLERPAPVYGNTDFHFLYDFMEQEYQKRQLWYFPESAWWLTFDNQLPLYLPITIEARDRDIQKLKHMLSGKLVGHHVFGTGHEWGYWQNEYCSFRMSADTDYRWTDCLEDITMPMGTAADEVRAVMEDVVAMQENEMIYGHILRYLVGTDPETEAAASIGVVFHELPPPPKAIMNWTKEEAESWQAVEAVELATMVAGYEALVARLEAVRADVPGPAAPFFDEILDGIKVTGLRAKHQLLVYGAVVKFRLAQLNLDEAMQTAARADLEAAIQVTADAKAVIAAREQQFRYQPLARSIGGGENCDQDENWTTYGFRVHCRTHNAYYWTRIDELAAEVILSTSQAVSLQDAFLTVNQNFQVAVTDAAVGAVDIDFGDGSAVQNGTSFTHAYATTGTYRIHVSGSRDGTEFTWSADVVAVESKTMTEFTGEILKPTGMEIVTSVMPNIVFGRIDADTVAVGYSAFHEGYVESGRFSILADNADPIFGGVAETLLVPIITKSDNSVLAELTVKAGSVGTADEGATLVIQGQMVTQSVVNAIIAVAGGGFDEAGAREVVASTIGYTPDTLPESVEFIIHYEIPTE